MAYHVYIPLLEEKGAATLGYTIEKASALLPAPLSCWRALKIALLGALVPSSVHSPHSLKAGSSSSLQRYFGRALCQAPTVSFHTR